MTTPTHLRKKIVKSTSLNTITASFAAFTLSVMSGATHASTCPFDTGGSDALNDGVVLTRYASLDPLQVKNNIECVGCALDMNGDGQIDTVDTTTIARYLLGLKRTLRPTASRLEPGREILQRQ
jgi:hypothetical protein